MLLIISIILGRIIADYNTPTCESIALSPGYHYVYLCGAQGGKAYNDGGESGDGGKGACVSGYLKITDSTKLFYGIVGGQGKSSPQGPNEGGYNGGGSSGKDTGWSNNDCSGGGGGATDLRISLYDVDSRIMVAAGGAGAVWDLDGSPGGDLYGRRVNSNHNVEIAFNEVDQTNGNTNGKGGIGKDYGSTPGSGGGGGWRGGIGSGDATLIWPSRYKSMARSGSSYISGYSGCLQRNDYVFASGKMEVGVRIGDGRLYIYAEYECSDNCLECSSESYCNRCSQSTFRYESSSTDAKCHSSCPPGTYSVSSTKQCYNCDSPCETCESTSTNCLTCVSGYFFYNNKCYQTCPGGTFELGNKCQKCPDTCTRCSSLTQCSECQIGYKFYKGSCVKPCPQSTLDNGNQCLDCNEGCLTCENSIDNCPTCKEGYYMKDNKCHKDCSIFTDANNGKYYGNNIAERICSICEIEFCNSCPNDHKTCTSCIDSHNLIEKENRCEIKPTTVFTQSEFFTRSNKFSKSNEFTESNGFTKSQDFSASKGFTSTSDFSKSIDFTQSQGFSKSKVFSNSGSFSPSTQFTKSNSFSKSNQFSKSLLFTKSQQFTSSNKFTKSTASASASVFTQLPTASDIIIDRNTNDSSLKGNKSSFPSYLIYVVIALGVVAIALIILFIFMKRRKKEDQTYEAEMSATCTLSSYQVTGKDDLDSYDDLDHEVHDPFNISMEEGVLPGL